MEQSVNEVLALKEGTIQRSHEDDAKNIVTITDHLQVQWQSLNDAYCKRYKWVIAFLKLFESFTKSLILGSVLWLLSQLCNVLVKSLAYNLAFIDLVSEIEEKFDSKISTGWTHGHKSIYNKKLIIFHTLLM